MELVVRVLACLAEGLGIRATARVFEVDPKTVLHWLVEAAEQLKAFSHYFLCEVHVQQVQLDELYAMLSAVKDGQMREEEAIRRLSRSSYGVWTAIDPPEQAAPGHHGRSAHAGHGSARRASGEGGARAGLHPAVRDRRVQGVHERAVEPFRFLGAA